MSILILEKESAEIREVFNRFQALGHKVQYVSTVERAMILARVDPPDLLITALFSELDRLSCESGLSVAMAAQFHNPALSTILLSDSLIFSQGELFSMLGSLRCVLRRPAPVDDLIEISQHILCDTPARRVTAAGQPDLIAEVPGQHARLCVQSDAALAPPGSRPSATTWERPGH